MRADRLLSILMLLQARGKLTTAELADTLEVSRRTVLRDVEALAMAGVPVIAEGGHGGGVSLDAGYRTSLTGLNEAEAGALFVPTNARFLSEVGLGAAAESSRRKLAAALPGRHQARVRALQQRIYIDATRWWQAGAAPDWWGDLQQAVHEDRALQLTYTDFSGRVSTREIEPHGLVSKTGAWYVVGRHAGVMKSFRVERILTLTLLARRFQRDPGFDLVQHWQASQERFREQFTTYACTAEVHPDQLAHLRWLAHGRHHFGEPCADGWLRVHMAFESRASAVLLLFGLGARVRAIAPADLREALLQACAACAAQHAGAGGAA